LVLVQITRTTPLRRTILQFSQIRLTLALTFMAIHPLNIQQALLLKKPANLKA